MPATGNQFRQLHLVSPINREIHPQPFVGGGFFLLQKLLICDKMYIQTADGTAPARVSCIHTARSPQPFSCTDEGSYYDKTDM